MNPLGELGYNLARYVKNCAYREPNEYNQSGQRGIVSCFGCLATQRHHSFVILLIAKGFTAYMSHTAQIPSLSPCSGQEKPQYSFCGHKIYILENGIPWTCCCRDRPQRFGWWVLESEPSSMNHAGIPMAVSGSASTISRSSWY
jgi:hypothetical protein